MDTALPPAPLRRVRVVGNSGAGKTTFAAKLARRLEVPHIELDAIFWAENWQWRPLDEVREQLEALLDGPAAGGWVACGNWVNRLNELGDLLQDADAIVWLDYPRRVIMPRVIWRTVRRGLTGKELWNGNRERLGNLFKRDPNESIVAWSWTEHDKYRARYAALAAKDSRVVRLGSPRAARRWLAAVPAAVSGAGGTRSSEIKLDNDSE